MKTTVSRNPRGKNVTNILRGGSSVTAVTDDRGRTLLHGWHDHEPEPGSVVMVNGEFGCAWQRQFDDGQWRSVRGGKPRDWAYMLARRNLVLVYDAAVRQPHRFDPEPTYEDTRPEHLMDEGEFIG